MTRLTSRISLKALSICAVVALNVVIFFCFTVQAGNPDAAYYSPANNRVFWFIQITDIHIGTGGSQDSANPTWIVNDARSIVEPAFIVATGDLTDCTDGALFPQNPCPEDEWIEYRAILSAADLAAIGTDFKDFYYDIPGTHDAYNDANFTFYCDYNLRNTNYPDSPTLCQKQLSWTREFSFGKYHFIGVNTAGNDGRGFWDGYWGDYAGLDSEELAFIQNELALQDPDVALTLIVGHHAMDETPGLSGDSWIYYGAPEFASLMETYGVSSYGYGHTHEFTEQFFTGGTDYHTVAPYSLSPGIFYININSLGKSSNNHFNITAIDCNGIATVTQAINTWPVVMITAPMDVDLGVADNPYSYNVPNSNTNPIRVLAFDANTPSSVQFRVDGGPWNAMPPTGNPHQYAGMWDASSLSEGYHTIEVQATSSSGTGTDSIITYVEAAGCSSTDLECDDSNPCTVDSCVEGNCQYGFEPDTTSCTGTSPTAAWLAHCPKWFAATVSLVGCRKMATAPPIPNAAAVSATQTKTLANNALCGNYFSLVKPEAGLGVMPPCLDASKILELSHFDRFTRFNVNEYGRLCTCSYAH